MKTKKRLIEMIILMFVQCVIYGQGVIKAESGARIVSQTGSYWALDHGSFTLVSPGAAYPVTMDNLTIDADASLTLGTLNYLTVNGSLVNAAGNSGLVVKSGASLIEGTPGVQATVELGIIAGEWHLISAPISNATANMFSGYYLQKHTESTNLYSDILASSTPLTPMQGFALFGDAGLPTATYTGTLNAGNESFTTTWSGVGKGWNLVGNPFPSSIDWDAPSGWVKNNVNDAVYIHVNSATWATYVAGVGANGGSRYIAPGQGFFVEATAAGTLAMNDDVRVHNATSFYKNDEFINYLVRLEVSGNNFRDETVVRFLPESTPQFDGGYDARKLFGDVTEAPQIYSMGNTELAINTLPETPAVPVGVRAGTNGAYTIKMTEINDLFNVSLEDTQTGVFTNLSKDAYSFNYTTGENEQRFILHFGSLPVKEKSPAIARIYSHLQTVYIDLKEQVKGEIHLYSMNGQLVTTSTAMLGINRITLEGPGIYVVRLVTDKGTVVRKVWVG